MFNSRWLNLIIWLLALVFLVAVLLERQEVSYGHTNDRSILVGNGGWSSNNAFLDYERVDGETINYANAISYEIKSERSLREDAVGLYGTQYTGVASYYGQAFAGRTTACGDIFDPSLSTAASLRHDCGTKLNVCLLGSSRCVVVVVNDTGAFESLGRVIDLSSGAFEKLAPLSQGLVSVRIEEELEK